MMKFKKIPAIIASAAIIASSMSIPAFADYDSVDMLSYTAADYDYTVAEETFDTGTATNTIDNTSAKAATDAETVYSFTDSSVMTKEFFMSFDFCFDTDGGSITIKNSGKYGPLFTISGGQLRTQISSNSYQKLGAANVGTWYTAEIEGKMVVAAAAATFRLYKYESGTKTLVQETTGLNLRQFYAGSTNGNPDRIVIENVSIDNLKIVQEYPNSMELSSTADEINAGASASLDYVLKRNDTETTKYAVTWSVYDKNNTTEITDGTVSVTDGVLFTNLSAPSETVTVRATATLGGKELVGTKQIKINAVDTSSEKFDTISINGKSSVKAGTSEAYTFTASKNGEDVTASLTDSDVVWSVYDSSDVYPNGNKAFSVTNGTLTVADGTIAQNITLRASSSSGNIYTSKPIEIKFSDSQTETVLASSACEETVQGVDKVDSFDGSKAYSMSATTKLLTFGNTSEYVLTELDVKLTAEGSGFTLNREDGTLNSCFRYYNNKMQMQTSSSGYSELMSADSGKWYHVEFLYGTDYDASCNIYEYNDDGTLGERHTFTDLSKRNGKAYGTLQIEGGTIVDNIKIVTPQANLIALSAVSTYIYSGDSDQMTAVITRNGLPLNNLTGLEWSVLDSSNLPIIDGSVAIDQKGLLTTSQTVPTQTVKVQAKSGAYTNTIEINIELLEPFEITNIGINEDGNKIVKLYINKKSGYNDDVIFIVAVYTSEGVLKGFKSVSGEGKSYAQGEQGINFDFDLDEIDFDSENDIIKGFVWTRF